MSWPTWGNCYGGCRPGGGLSSRPWIISLIVVFQVRFSIICLASYSHYACFGNLTITLVYRVRKRPRFYFFFGIVWTSFSMWSWREMCCQKSFRIRPYVIHESFCMTLISFGTLHPHFESANLFPVVEMDYSEFRAVQENSKD